MNLRTGNNTEIILNQFDDLSVKVEEARNLFENGQIKKSYEKLWSVDSLAKRLSQRLSWYRCRIPNGRSFAEATSREVEQLAKLNTVFEKLQDQTRNKIADIKKELDEKLGDGEIFMDEYEIDVQVFFILGENDPFYLDDDDNFILKLSCPVFYVEDEEDSPLDNFNDMAHLSSHPLHGQVHCHFFHELLDHTESSPSLDDVLRIAEIWIDIKVYHQCFQDLPRLKGRNKNISVKC